MTRAVEVSTPIQVRTYDVDFAGVVSNTVYVKWLEDLRLAMTGPPHNLPFVSLIEEGIAPAILSTEIKFRRPIRLGDEVTGNAWFSHMDRRRATAEYEIWANGSLAANAVQQGIFVRLADFRFVSAPESWTRIYHSSKSKDTSTHIHARTSGAKRQNNRQPPSS